jgi:D-alanyl-D-alanine carboxypeptidase (penicillin-binding protein 5/6)
LFIFLALSLSLSLGSAGTALAEEASGYTGDLSGYGAVLLIDANSGTVLVSHNADGQIEPASTTKIMTCILALENAKLDDEVTISEKAAGASGQSLGLAKGETVKMSDLLNAMMMYSGNDAAVAVAEHVSGDVTTFVDMMNAKAQALDMKNTHFVNPNGLHDDNHLSTAEDMAKLTQYAMKNAEFMNIVKQESFTMPQSDKRMEKTYDNTNHLMDKEDSDYYSYATGVKTGSTSAAGACLVATATKDGMNLICLIFKDESEDGVNRWSLSKSLFDYGFDNYTTVDVQTLLAKAPSVQIQIENYAAGDKGDGLLTFEAPSSPGTLVTVKKSTAQGILDSTDTEAIEAVPAYDDTKLTAPILKGDVLGTVTYKNKATGDELYTGPLIASRDIAEAGAEPDASGGTAVSVMPAVSMEDINKHDGDIFYWLIPPGILIAVLVWRLVTVQHRKRKRFSKKRPHYSYRIK